MDRETYRFKVGSFDCTAISDGTFTYAPPAFPPAATLLFANAPEERLRPVLNEHGVEGSLLTAWVSTYTCLVVDTGEHLVLVDTGAGNLSPSTGRLVENLRAAGINPRDIDTVIITHAHPDHIGGATDGDGEVVFPNARWLMWKSEFDFWRSDEADLKFDAHSREVLIGTARRSLSSIGDRLQLLDREGEIIRGIHATAIPGHTPGHMAIAVSSGSDQLLCIADTVLHPIQCEHPEWHALVDLNPSEVVEGRIRLLTRAAALKSLVLAFHFPFPGLGHLDSGGDGWKWQPIGDSG